MGSECNMTITRDCALKTQSRFNSRTGASWKESIFRIAHSPIRTGNVCATVLAVLTIVLHAPSAFAVTQAEGFVQQNIEKGYSILNDGSLPAGQRHLQFRNFMLGVTDTNRIALFTLGRYANGASKAELDAFDSGFSDFELTTYESLLSKFKGLTLKVTGSTELAQDDTVVNVDVVRSDSTKSVQPVKAAFRLRKAEDGRLIVADIQVEGIWLSLVQRSDFSGFLQQHGGSIAALTAQLPNRLRNIALGASNES
jgi:phospholipid transport system substrate-binding protein